MNIILPNTIEIKAESDLPICAKYILNTNLGITSKAKIHEKYSLCLFLLAQYSLGKFEYPTTIEILGTNDPPDFIINYPNPPKSIGLEHTRATNESYMVASNKMRRSEDISWLESSYYTFKEALSKRDAFFGLKRDNESLSGSPTYGNAHISNWVDFVFAAYMKKNQSSSNPQERTFERSELLVEVIIPNMIGDQHPKALSLLRKKLVDESENIPQVYHKLHIISQGYVIIDATGKSQSTLLRKADVKCLSGK